MEWYFDGILVNAITCDSTNYNDGLFANSTLSFNALSSSSQTIFMST